jgi:hypothetical protein
MKKLCIVLFVFAFSVVMLWGATARWLTLNGERFLGG